MDDSLLQELRKLFGKRCTTNATVLQQHSHGESHHESQPPDAVVFVQEEAEVMRTLELCRQYKTPLIAFGAGTCIEGQVQAVNGGICMDFSRMNRILAVNTEDMDCIVEPGVTREQLNSHLRDQGLFFPVDPGANATIGGMIATDASGTTTILYGSMRQNVLGMDALLASGAKINTGTRARKSSAGYNLTELLVGSEGTLALTLAARIRLYGVPESVVAARVEFDDLHSAVNSVIHIIQAGIPIARIELLEQFSLRAINQYCHSDYPETPTLFLEFHGSESGTVEQKNAVREICTANGGSNFFYATLEEEKSAMWHARHNAYYAALARVPGGKGWVTDVAVPVSKLADCILQTRADLEKEGLDIPIVGHVGDGNFHLLFSIPPEDKQLLERAKQINERLVVRAREMGGTCTGEHGIGLGKKQYLLEEKGQQTVDAMRLLKKALDPDGLLNPGKIF